ncbi:39S ribosomal protein L40, mitochondrial isoform X2 [Dermochelys coriacea]|uniref:39S ribosomal protein L40, mitochondrial isoform X2 n=1 Tax=Dermochelys coriacea TaxID=27794 RepID=UPI0018E7FCD0|nr:39S ribosomal protein L40, mitochondrial isoform X2 [Dermochelys coriacea]
MEYYSSQLSWTIHFRGNHWQTSMLAFQASLPMRAEPRKKKKADPRREQAQKDRMKKKIKKLEKAAQEMIPIEDFVTPFKFLDASRARDISPLSFEESERRALLLKKWALYKQKEHEAEMKTLKSLMAAQQEALEELRLESEELYQAAIRRDDDLFPFEKEGPTYTPQVPGYEAPEGKCIDITKVYTQ